MTTNVEPSSFLWVEAFRPQTLDDVIIPQRVKDELRGFINQGQIPNLLLASASPGTGKTTVAKALCNELGVRPLFINASLNNSIEDIRMMVVNYATTVSLTGSATKVVILDEGERLSTAAQESLKGLIEQVHNNCRFIITTNTKGRIIEPLVSRCSEIDFVFTTEEQTKVSAQMIKRLTEILTDRQVTFKVPVLVEVVKRYAPDNRKILNVLQQYASSNKTIDEGLLARISSGSAETIVTAMKAKDFASVKQWVFDNFDSIQDDFYLKLYRQMEKELNPQSIPEAIITINDYQRHHATVPDRFVHFLSLACVLMMNVTFK